MAHAVMWHHVPVGAQASLHCALVISEIWLFALLCGVWRRHNWARYFLIAALFGGTAFGILAIPWIMQTLPIFPKALCALASTYFVSALILAYLPPVKKLTRYRADSRRSGKSRRRRRSPTPAEVARPAAENNG